MVKYYLAVKNFNLTENSNSEIFRENTMVCRNLTVDNFNLT